MKMSEGVQYTKDQQRVAEYINKMSGGAVGGGEDPIGFLIASHHWLATQRAQLAELEDLEPTGAP